CAGIGLDYPIVRGGDNNYYLSHLFDGTKNKLGSIFMDYRNNPEFQDKNTVIYGHHMKNGAMFSTLMDYKDQEFLNDHPRIEIDTPNGPLTMKIFSGFIVNTTEFEAKCQFANNVEFMEYINKAIAQSCFETRVNVKPTDKIVTLYTCSYEYDGARFVLMGVI
ncbi:MAG: class B sortase, partial [Clostridiales bacterium]